MNRDLLNIVLFIVAYFAISRWLLPRLGIPT